MVRRYGSDGSFESSFAMGSVLGSYSEAYAMALQLDGKIVVAGLKGTSSNASTWDSVVLRFKPDGTRDTDFGVVTQDFSGPDRIYNLDISSTGKIIAAGSNFSGDYCLLVLNPDGSRDTTFTNNGAKSFPISQLNSAYTGVQTVSAKALADGSLLVSGWQYNSGQTLKGTSIFRVLPNSLRDTAFGATSTVPNGTVNNGVVTLTGYLDDLLVMKDSFIVSGRNFTGANQQFTAAKFNLNGQIDTLYGVNGIAQGAVFPGNVQASSAVLPNGTLLIASSAEKPTVRDLILTNFDQSGKVVGTKPQTRLGVSSQSTGVLELDLSPLQSLLKAGASQAEMTAALNDVRLNLSYDATNLNFPKTFNLSQRAVIGNILYFVGGSDGGLGLWRTDGTVVGTYPVRQNSLAAPMPMTANDQLIGVDTNNDNRSDQVFFTSQNQIWTLNGQSKAVPITNLANVSNLSNLTYLGQKGTPNPESILFFTATEGAVNKLWHTDSSEAGVFARAVVTEHTANPAKAPLALTVTTINSQPTLFFTADESLTIGTRKLWTVPLSAVKAEGNGGTSAGIVSNALLNPAKLTAAPNLQSLFLAGDQGTSATYGLYRVTSTAGFNLVQLHTGSTINNLKAVGDRFVYSVGSANELWISNGTSAGTDRARGSKGSLITDAAQLTPVGTSKLMFTASSDTRVGQELMQYDTAAVPGNGNVALASLTVGQVRVTLAAPHNLSDGDVVVIQGAVGLGASRVNGQRSIRVIDSLTIELEPDGQTSSVSTDGGTWSQLNIARYVKDIRPGGSSGSLSDLTDIMAPCTSQRTMVPMGRSYGNRMGHRPAPYCLRIWRLIQLPLHLRIHSHLRPRRIQFISLPIPVRVSV